MLRKHNSYTHLQYINSLTTTNKSLWKATKQLLKSKNSIPPLRYPDDPFVIFNSDKAKLFTTHLANNVVPYPNLNNTDNTAQINQLLNSPLPMFPY